ncbi:hypothetical protein K525DRAFT_259520 [Schizophyllum commune Loenen D]|nr:hypothetical protein K525DRAFT_259520 [Schizophyllum commune Loenen D]
MIRRATIFFHPLFTSLHILLHLPSFPLLHHPHSRDVHHSPPTPPTPDTPPRQNANNRQDR